MMFVLQLGLKDVEKLKNVIMVPANTVTPPLNTEALCRPINIHFSLYNKWL